MAEGGGNIVKEGWLQKRGEYIQNWRDRYFILFDDGDLLGFKSQPEPNNYGDPLNKYTVHDCRIIEEDKPWPYTFTFRGLQVNSNTIIERNFSVDSEKEREGWVAAIRLVARKLGGGEKETRLNHSIDISKLGPAFRDLQRITLDKFEFVKLLGKGAFGKVLLSREKSTGKLFAMKILKKHLIMQKDELAHTRTENLVLKKISHPFLMSLRYSFQTADRVWFVMECVNGGELHFNLSRERPFSEERTRFYGAEIASALGYLHSEGIIYRELMLENVLLDKDGHVKIADFATFRHGRFMRSFCGPPEVLEEAQYGPAVDWWGFGVVLYEMACGRPPFYNLGRDHQIFRVIRSHDVQFPRGMSPSCSALLVALLAKDPRRRLGAGPADAADVMAHPFFAAIDWADLLAKRIPVPFKPQVESDTDTRYFDSKLTAESVKLTSPDYPAQQHTLFLQCPQQDIPSSGHSALLHLSARAASR